METDFRIDSELERTREKRRLYEVMVAWETMNTDEQPLFIKDYADIWQEADKIVYSRTLQTVTSARTRLQRDFDPETIQRLKATAQHDITVGAPDLAAAPSKPD